MWDSSANATGYKAYSSTGTAWTVIWVSEVPTTTATVPTATNLPTRYYVTAFNSSGESQPSNIVTNTPPPGPTPAPILVLVPPTVMPSTNLLVGSTATFTSIVRNDGNADLQLTDGALTLLPPGAARGEGKNIDVAAVPPQTLKGGTSIGVQGQWTVLPSNGVWNAYVIVKDGNGVWTASTFTQFNVTTNTAPPIPQPPQNLKVSALGRERIDVSWDNAQPSTVLIERAKDRPTAFVQIASVIGTFYADTGLRRNSKYWYRARSQNAGGTSAYSETVWEKTDK